tara:strand:- start:10307 stop:11590 length:1284 start_codon:yes stop_codon:yes gene_type:complete
MFKALYNFIITIIYIPYIFAVFLRRFKKKEHHSKFKEKFLFTNCKRPNGYLFWFHVASLGEFTSILPIVDFYLEKNAKYKFLITTTTLSSYYQFEKKFGNNERVFHQFMPYDLRLLVKKFLNNWQPNIVSFVESEIWPNFIFEIKKRKLPFILLNARITKKTFRRWIFFKKFAQNIFNSFSSCISSNKESEEYLRLLNAKNIKYFGNIKFCAPIKTKKNPFIDEFISIKNKKVWVALSTHDDEEDFCLKVHKLIEKVDKNIVTIIIPRHISRVNRIHSKLLGSGLKIQIKNEKDAISENAQIILVNYYGLTSKYLDNFKQVFIGKSLIPSLAKVGGQNPIDAIKMGCKVYHGPYVYNFQEIYDYLDQNNFAEKIDEDRSISTSSLAKKLISNFKDKSVKNINKIEELNNYSKKIFNNIDKEYSKFIQ